MDASTLCCTASRDGPTSYLALLGPDTESATAAGRVEGKPLIPLRMIPWEGEFEHETGRELFGSNLLALTWIKGEAMPGKLVDEVLRGLGLARETEKQQRQRRNSVVPM